MKNLNRLNSEKKIVIMMLTVMFVAVNIFTFYISYSRVKTNIEHIASKISGEINNNIRENYSIASLLATKFHSSEKLSTPSTHTAFDDFAKTFSTIDNFKFSRYYTDGKRILPFTENPMKVDDTDRIHMLSDVSDYIQKTTKELNRAHGFAVPDLYYSSIHKGMNSQHSWIAIGIPVVINDYSSHVTITPGIIATDYTAKEIFDLFDEEFKINNLDVNAYSINIHSRKSNVPTMIISESGLSLFDFSIPGVNLTNGYYITSAVNLRTLINSAPEIFINANLLMTFVSLLFLMLHNSSLQMLNRLITDSLTQALSREGGRLVIEGMSAKKGQVIIVTDLNDFKIINDTYGHHAGDEALAYFTGYVMSELREKDSMIRMGGDEFMLLMSDVSVKQAEDKMAQLAEGLHSFPHEGCEIPLTFSYGVSAITDEFSDSYKNADERLYEMKHRHHAQK
ncbi:diguanylate cyclase [Enterobacteriaceae bacterium RIT691]|nr:diguanylate cyclase [Enterobacteriaceae bacterium RIT691]